MKLSRPFYRLTLALDVARLEEEVAGLAPHAWVSHPGGLAGNSAVRLISKEGGENDAVDGEMRPTLHLAAMPYVRQVLASIGVVWSRSRLMRLAPGSCVPEHSDINHHWFHRVRLHMPVVTDPRVTFHCGGDQVHMAAGEVWLFDNWRLHRVENPTPYERIHLVADTSGSAAFWRFVATCDAPGVRIREIRFDPSSMPQLLTERGDRSCIMHPGELELLIADLRSDIAPGTTAEGRSRIARYTGVLEGLCRDWRQLYALHGDADEGRDGFMRLRDSVREVTARLAPGLVMQSNGVALQRVLEARVLQHLICP